MFEPATKIFYLARSPVGRLGVPEPQSSCHEAPGVASNTCGVLVSLEPLSATTHGCYERLRTLLRFPKLVDASEI